MNALTGTSKPPLEAVAPGAAPHARAVADLWRFRGLLVLLVERDLKVRYKRSVLGMFWTLLNPLLQMGVYTLVFSTILRIGVPRLPALRALRALALEPDLRRRPSPPRCPCSGTSP